MQMEMSDGELDALLLAWVAAALTSSSAEDSEPIVSALERLTPDASAALLAKADRHGVGPLLYRWTGPLARRLAAAGHDVTPLRDQYLATALRALRIATQLDELLVAFASAAIPAMPLKGAHLAFLVYGDPAVRPMIDLDILV